MRHRTVIAALAGVLCVAAAVTAVPAAAATRALAWDFNGDGYRDLAVGVHTGTVAGKEFAGYVVVIPGSATGAVSAKKYLVDQGSAGVPGEVAAYDNFGTHLASYDFNTDGYADLAVAAGGDDDQGTVILWGGNSGLSGGTAIIGSDVERLGSSGLAIGDVTQDGVADIVAVGGGDGPDEPDRVKLIKGPLSPAGTPVATGIATVGNFTTATGVAIGDFNGGGRNDVAIPYIGDFGSGTLLLRGTSTGGLAATTTWYHETTGRSIVAADLNRDGYGDLAYGNARTGPDTPKYPVNQNVGGVVRILYGSSRGPAGTRKPVDISQQTPGVPGSGTGDFEVLDGFGWDLAVADINGDGHKDLAVGTPFEDIGELFDAGSTTVLYGTASGIGGAGARAFSQETAGVSGVSEELDAFGYQVRLRDLNGNVRPELVVGVPFEDSDSGRVVTLPGSGSGITGSGAKSYSAAGLGLPAGSQFGNRFGDVLG